MYFYSKSPIKSLLPVLFKLTHVTNIFTLHDIYIN